MRLLLDPHIYLWYLSDSRRLSPAIRRRIATAEEVFVSAATIWEAGVKLELGKLTLDADVDDLILGIDASGFAELPVTARQVARAARLPRIHADPFDRLLIAQAFEAPRCTS